MQHGEEAPQPSTTPEPAHADQADFDREELIATVTRELKRFETIDADDRVLEQCVRDTVVDLWSEPVKVIDFIPVLTIREVREKLDHRFHSKSA